MPPKFIKRRIVPNPICDSGIQTDFGPETKVVIETEIQCAKTESSSTSMDPVIHETKNADRLSILRGQEVIEVDLDSQPLMDDFPIARHFTLAGHWELVPLGEGGKSNHTIRFKDDSRITGEQFVYLIIVNGRIVKIGGSKKTIIERIQSYNCGVYSRWRGGNGKQSVTNSVVYDSIEICLLRGLDVKMFVWMVPAPVVSIDLWGEKTEIVVATVYDRYETHALRIFYDMFGKNPVWSKNGRCE
jgi:hypothetical protein